MSNKICRKNILLRTFGIMVLAVLILAGAACAAPFAYVASLGVDTGTVFVIDTATDNLTAVMPVGGWPEGVAVNSAGTKVYVATGFDPTISVIDTATNSVVATINIGVSTVNAAVTPDGKKIYATNSRNNTTSVIDAATNKITATVPVGDHPTDVAVSPDGNKVYVTNTGSSDVSVIDIEKNTVTATVNSGKYTINYPTGVAIGPLTDYDVTDQSTGVTSNATEDIGIEETNFSSSDEKKLLNSIIQRIILNLIMIVAQVEMSRAKITLLQASDYWAAWPAFLEDGSSGKSKCQNGF